MQETKALFVKIIKIVFFPLVLVFLLLKKVAQGIKFAALYLLLYLYFAACIIADILRGKKDR